MKQDRPPGDSSGGSAPPAPPDRLGRSLRALPATEASPGFTDRVLTRVATQAPARAAEGRRRRAALPALIGAGAAALGALVLLLRPAGGPSSGPGHTASGASPPDAELATPAGPPDPAGIDPAAVGAELERLRQEQRDLAAAVETLRDRRDPVMPVIYVGRRGDVDLILDLTRFARRAGADRGGER